MADQDRAAPRALTLFRALAEKPFAFGFFQAVRRIESAFPNKPRVGRSLHAEDDPIRFGQAVSMIFAPATLESFDQGEGGRPPRMIGFFLGLLGPNGPMPLHLTEHTRDRVRNAHDPTTARFFDLFNHRMLSLFYRAWANSRPTVQFDRPDSDRFGDYVGSAFGLGQQGVRARDGVPDLAKLHFAGLFAAQSRHPEGLRSILEGFFKLPVRIEEFVGAWMEIPPKSRWHVGRAGDQLLGLSLTLGARVWGRHQKFRIAFGPLSLADYERLLPGGASLNKLVPLVRAYVGDELTWDANLILKEAEVPKLILGRFGRLGWTTWLMPRPKGGDADDLKLNPLGNFA